MAESLSTPSHQVASKSKPSPHSSPAQARNLGNFSEEPSSRPIPDLAFEKGELMTQLSVCVRIDWEDLQCFEVVNHQFQNWGVEFKNAIALRPSNQAYPAYSGSMVVMGAPKDGWLEATFLKPVRFVSGFITSSRRTVLSAFDSSNNLLAQIESPGANLATDAPYPSNLRLSLNASNIHRVTFHTFNGHLTLDDFCFCD